MAEEIKADRPPVCDYEGSDYQSAFWDSGDRAYEDQVEAIALQRLLPERGDLLLEVGAGAGRNTPRYTGFGKVVLLDYSRSQLQLAQARLGISARYIYVAADVYRLPFVPGLFDAATMIRTLHHMADPQLALRQVRRTLKPGAVFILEFANKRNFKAIFRYLFRRQSWNPFSLEPVEFATLNFDFHPRAILRGLQEEGYKVERLRSVSHFRSPVLKRAVPLRLLVGLDARLQSTGNWLQFSPSVFIRSIAVGDSEQSSPGSLFACPACGHFPLPEMDYQLTCKACGRVWAVHDGIYDFKQPLSSS